MTVTRGPLRSPAPLILLILGVSVAAAQAPARRGFEAVSIKPSSTSDSGAVAIGSASNPQMVQLRGITPKALIAQSYALKPYEVQGPAWLESERYDISARAAEPLSDADKTAALRELLAARFQMNAHAETRSLPAYALVAGKSGIKLREVQPDGVGLRYFPNKAGITATQISMAQLADLLSSKLDRPTIDKTGISGRYNIDLRWAPQTAEPGAELGPSVFTVIQEIGLKLESTTAPIGVLVIDHIERPSLN